MKNYKQNTFVLALLFGLLSIAAHAAPPVNDFWSDATLISGASGAVNGTVIEATTQTCELDRVFPEGVATTANKSVWYKWQAPANGSFSFKIPVTLGVDTTLSAYRFTLGLCNGNIVSVPNRIVENHDYNFNLGLSDKSRITFRAIAGEVIFIAVDSYDDSTGNFVMAWEKTKYRYSAQLDSNNGGTDLAVTRDVLNNNTEFWMARHYISSFINNYSMRTFGLHNDKKFVADFDGDGISDFASVRSNFLGTTDWWIANRNGIVIRVVPFGREGDRPVVGDYDGDGIADLAVTRTEANNTKTWHILRSSDGQYQGLQFGLSGDREMVGDYDGDGKTDVVVLRIDNSTGTYTWYIHRSTDGSVMVREFGKAYSDIPQAADFDGDGKTDITMFRHGFNDTYTGYWLSLDSSSELPLAQVPTRFQQFGQGIDIPQAGDYDGDGKTDLAIFRENTGEWWIKKSVSGQMITYRFGKTSDEPRADTGIAANFLATF